MGFPLRSIINKVKEKKRNQSIFKGESIPMKKKRFTNEKLNPDKINFDKGVISIEDNVFRKKPILKLKWKTEDKAMQEHGSVKASLKKEKETGKVTSTKKQKPVKIIFLGGVGEIGKNMTALEYGNDVIIIDAGLTFPNSEDMPGVDSVIPDYTYLTQNKEKIRGIFLTHGHEDHIGSLPYVLQEINVPIYGTRLTLGIVEQKLKEFLNI